MEKSQKDMDITFSTRNRLALLELKETAQNFNLELQKM